MVGDLYGLRKLCRGHYLTSFRGDRAKGERWLEGLGERPATQEPSVRRRAARASKLGVSFRATLVAWAVEAGIVSGTSVPGPN